MAKRQTRGLDVPPHLKTFEDWMAYLRALHDIEVRNRQAWLLSWLPTPR